MSLWLEGPRQVMKISGNADLVCLLSVFDSYEVSREEVMGYYWSEELKVISKLSKVRLDGAIWGSSSHIFPWRDLLTLTLSWVGGIGTGHSPHYIAFPSQARPIHGNNWVTVSPSHGTWCDWREYDLRWVTLVKKNRTYTAEKPIMRQPRGE